MIAHEIKFTKVIMLNDEAIPEVNAELEKLGIDTDEHLKNGVEGEVTSEVASKNPEGEVTSEGTGENPEGEVTSEVASENPEGEVTSEVASKNPEEEVTSEVASKNPEGEVTSEVASENLGAEVTSEGEEERQDIKLSGVNKDEIRPKTTRKRAGKEVKSLFEVPGFPSKLTTAGVLEFLKSDKSAIRNALETFIDIALNPELKCSMEWEDLLKVANTMNKQVRASDKRLVAKQIADVFEEKGYSIRQKAFLKLLRAHKEGKVSLPIPTPAIKAVQEKFPPNQKADIGKKSEGRRKNVPQVEVNPAGPIKIEDFTDIPCFSQFDGSQIDREKKCDLIQGIMQKMGADKLSIEARMRFYYSAVCTVSVAEYKPEGIKLLISDYIEETGNKVPDPSPEIDKELNQFVMSFLESEGCAKYSYNAFMGFLNVYFRTYFRDSDFVSNIIQYEALFGEKLPEEIHEEEKPKGRFERLEFNPVIEGVYQESLDRKDTLTDIMANIFAKFKNNDLDDEEYEFLKVCAELIAFDNFNNMYIDMGINSMLAKTIQVRLATMLDDFVQMNNLRPYTLFDFLTDIRRVYKNNL